MVMCIPFIEYGLLREDSAVWIQVARIGFQMFIMQDCE